MTRADTERWAQELEAVMERVGDAFWAGGAAPAGTGLCAGLLAPVARKHGWQLAAMAGDRTPDGVQDLRARAHGDAELVHDELHSYVVEDLGAEQAMLVLDETGFLKKGDKSCGGATSILRHCRAHRELPERVFLTYASRHGQALLDRALYLPPSWAPGRPRRAAASVPAPVAFTTKPQLGSAMLTRALAAGVPCAWVVGASVAALIMPCAV